jgi:hypothetical protein
MNDLIFQFAANRKIKFPTWVSPKIHGGGGASEKADRIFLTFLFLFVSQLSILLQQEQKERDGWITKGQLDSMVFSQSFFYSL